MIRRKVTILLALGLAFLFAPVCVSQAWGQDAAAVPWKLDFEITKLDSVAVAGPAGHAETVWYALYAVTNNTGEERPLAPHFRATTDTGKTYFETSRPAAARLVERKIGKKVVGTKNRPASLGNGDRFEGIAVFGAMDPGFDRIQIAVTGITDVVYRVGTKRFFEKKALTFEWKRPGDEYFVRWDPVRFVRKQWKTVEGPTEIR